MNNEINDKKALIKAEVSNEEKKNPKLLSSENIKSYFYVLAVIFGIIAIFY